MNLIEQLKSEQKDAMRAKAKLRLGTIRMALAAVKQREVDERITLNDDDVIVLLTKMVKQRKDAASQFADAGRQELADKELAEIDILNDFLPAPLTEQELESLLAKAIEQTGASGMQDMGKVMGMLKPQVQGRTDMGKLSGIIKNRLTS